MRQESVGGFYPLPNHIYLGVQYFSVTEGLHYMSQNWRDIVGNPDRDRLIAAMKADIGVPHLGEVSALQCAASVGVLRNRAPICAL